MIYLTAPKEGAVCSLSTEIQRLFIGEEDRRAAMDGNLTFRWYDLVKEGCDRSLPEGVVFRWRTDSDPDEKGMVKGCYFLLISEHEDMRDALVTVCKRASATVYNLKIDTRYFWCVQRLGKRSAVRSFRTSYELPRCIKIDGISNVRDMGGYTVEEGKIRQGLVYRGGEFERHMALTPEGAEQLRALGIRTDLDMRGEAVGKVDYATSALFGMDWRLIPSVPYTEVFAKKNQKNVRAFYKVFTKKSAYPIYYHCWGGADRTGTFAFILGAFLGMKREDLIFEYEFTSLATWGARSRNYREFAAFLEKFDALKGNTDREKATSYLKGFAGLSDKELALIYDTMVEKA